MKLKSLSLLPVAGFLCTAISFAVATNAVAGEPVAQQNGVATTITAPAQGSQSSSIDFANAIPMPLPKNTLGPVAPTADVAPTFPGVPGFVPGGTGDGKETPTTVPVSNFIEDETGVSPQEFGSFNHPYTTSEVNVFGNQTSKFYPYRATGKLYFNINGGTYVCSASLIAPGILVTAAHCVAGFGTNSFYSGWTFVPAKNGAAAPYGTWGWSSATVMTSYINGSDSCAQSGVICQNDVALIRLAPQFTRRGAAYYAGNKTGWYGFGWNGYSYTSFAGLTAAQISQLGYPQAIDSGNFMQRTDSLGYVNGGLSNNTVIGSLQTGGSSGGPWLVNLGMTPSLNGTSFGSAASHNIVVGVTSWGYISDLPKEQGASPFTSGNILFLYNTYCSVATNPGC